MKDNYDVTQHPDAKLSKRTEDQVLLDFLTAVENYIEYKDIRDGKLTLKEFIEFFSFISFAIDNDHYFEMIMQGAWGGSRQ